MSVLSVRQPVISLSAVYCYYSYVLVHMPRVMYHINVPCETRTSDTSSRVSPYVPPASIVYSYSPCCPVHGPWCWVIANRLSRSSSALAVPRMEPVFDDVQLLTQPTLCTPRCTIVRDVSTLPQPVSAGIGGGGVEAGPPNSCVSVRWRAHSLALCSPFCELLCLIKRSTVILWRSGERLPTDKFRASGSTRGGACETVQRMPTPPMTSHPSTSQGTPAWPLAGVPALCHAPLPPSPSSVFSSEYPYNLVVLCTGYSYAPPCYVSAPAVVFIL